MRLCRQDSNEVRTISARALYNFSCDPDTVEPLRRHHILSFIKVCVCMYVCVYVLPTMYDNIYFKQIPYVR